MLKARYLLVLVAVATVGAVGYVLREDRARTPAALIAGAKERLAEAEPDFDAVLRELDLALSLAAVKGDRKSALEAYIARGEAYTRRGVPAKARADYTTALTEYAPGSSDLILRIGWLDLQLENYNAALTAAGTVLAQMPWHAGAHSLRGFALQRLAELSMEEAKGLLDAGLPDAVSAGAYELAWQTATLDFGHPTATRP